MDGLGWKCGSRGPWVSRVPFETGLGLGRIDKPDKRSGGRPLHDCSVIGFAAGSCMSRIHYQSGILEIEQIEE